MSLYDELNAAGVKLDNHEGDLYCEATPLAKAILSHHEHYARTATFFRDEVTRAIWLDIPFGFDPFYLRRHGVSS